MSTEAAYECFHSPLHGNGVRATVPIQAGTAVFVERPMCCIQSLSNKQNAICCANCLQFLGSSDFQLGVLTRKINRVDGFSSDSSSELSFYSDIIPCRACCGEYYCSLDCQDRHWNHSHKLLCTGYVTEEEAEAHPLIKFKYHAVSTNEIFLLCAEVYAAHCTEIEALMQGEGGNEPLSFEQAVATSLSKYAGYVRNLWWEVAIAPQGTSQKVLNRTLQRLVGESWTLLSDALDLPGRGLAEILGPEYYSRTIGMFEQNNVGIRLANPLGQVLLSGQEGEPLFEQVKNAVEEVVSNMEDGKV